MPRLSMIMFMLCSLICPIVTGAAQEKSTQTLTVLSLNLQHGTALGGGYDLPGIGELLQEQKADVLALQEVDRRHGSRSRNEDQPAVLAKMLGLPMFFGANIGSTHGNLLFSRHGFAQVRNHLFTKAPNRRKRQGMIAATITASERQLRIYNVQLDSASTPVRNGQFNSLVKMLREDKLPVIVCGDFGTQNKTQLKRLSSQKELQEEKVENELKWSIVEQPWLISIRALKKLPRADDDIYLSPELQNAVVEVREIAPSSAKRKVLCITLDLDKIGPPPVKK